MLKMVLDALDLKILSVLDEDARLAEAAIGKKVGTSKQVVRYRLNKLKEEGIVENYYTMMDVGKLGYDSYYVFVQLTGLNLNEENEIYKKMLKLPYISWLITGVGRWDSVILVCSKSIAQFNEHLEELKKLLGKHLHEYIFTTLIKAEHVSYKFVRSTTKESLKTTPKNKILTLDKIDKAILKTLNQSGRMLVTDLSLKTKYPLYTVHHRLKQLKKEKIIQGFRPKINVQKLGIQWHLLLIKFKSVSEERAKKFIEFCKNNKYVYYATNTVGLYNVMLDVHVKNTEEFRDFLFEIKESFEDVILLYESIVVFEEKILTYVPSIVLED